MQTTESCSIMSTYRQEGRLKGMEEKWLSVKEAAELLGVSDRTIRNLCSERKLKHRRLSERNIQFQKAWLEEFADSLIIEPTGENQNSKGENENE